MRLAVMWVLLAACVAAHAALPAAIVVHAMAVGPQQLAIAGLRSVNSQGQFNAVRRDASGNLYLLMDQKDGVRVLKFDAAATTVLAQVQLGAKGDIGVAMALDAAGNVYVTGTTTSGSLTASGSAAFNSYSGSAITSFAAKFDSNLNTQFVTFTGGARMAASALAVSGDAVFVTGSVFGAGLPVTSNGIIQAPPSGTTQNGFVEKFSLDGRSLLYATYLGGQNGYTAPAAIAVDASDDAYITGYTTATGYPTVNALVPELIPTPNETPGANGQLLQQSGFLTELTPGGDGLTFSTFISGSGMTSIALDPTGKYLLLSGGIAAGQFPVTSYASTFFPAVYQALLKMTVDGISVLSSTALLPSLSSTLAQDAAGNVWVAGSLNGVLFPQSPLADIGDSYAVRVNGNDRVDETLRFGGLPTSNIGFTTSATTLTSLATDAAGNVMVAGSFQPVEDANTLATQRYDLPLLNTPTVALPSSIRSMIPSAVVCGTSGQCAASGGYLAKVNAQAGAALSLSVDGLPNLTLRNQGSTAATGVQITATGYSMATGCGSTLGAGGECAVALTGAGPGTLTVLSAAQTFTAMLPANTNQLTPDPIVFAPKELDFGVQSSASAAATQTITVTNLTGQSQNFGSRLDQTTKTATGYSFIETANDCGAGATSTTHVLAPNAACHITIGFSASSAASNDGFVTANWLLGTRDIVLTGYTQAAALSVSSPELDFGTQFAGGLRLPRYFYLSNQSGEAIAHTAVVLPSSSAFLITDRCPDMLLPHSICQVQVDYLSATAPSADSVVLNLDAGLTVLLTGQTLPQPTVSGATANPNLRVTPLTLNFPNPVLVTSLSSTSQQVRIANTGAATFTLGLSITGDFTYTTNCPVLLAGGTSCTAFITFAPSQPNVRDGLLAVTASGGGAVYVALSGVGTPIITANAPVNNGTLDFGIVPLNEPAVQWIKLSQPLTSLTATATPQYGVVLVEDYGYGHGQPGAAAFQQTITGSCTNCWLGVQFTPAAAGVQAGTLQLFTVSGGSPYVLALTGTGIPLSGPYLTQVSVDFGPVPLHSSSAPHVFTLTNGGAQPVPVSSPMATGDFSIASTNCGSSLAAGDSCNVLVVFTPTTTGPRNGALTLTTGTTAQTASLTAYGSADPGIALNPTALIFNNVAAASAIVQTVTVTNTSSSAVQLGLATTGTPAFGAASQCATLAAGASCTVQVTYKPGTSLASDTLRLPVTTPGINGGLPSTTNYTVALTGAYAAEDAGLSITPAEMDYGPAATMTAGDIRLFTITNLTAKSIAVTINFPRQFAPAGPVCGGLAPYASCQFGVQFVPLTNGDITGSILAIGDPGDGSGTLNGIAYLMGYGQGGASVGIGGAQQPAGIVDFGSVTSGQTAQKALTLTNNSQSPLHIRHITSDYPFLATSNCGAALAMSASCSVTLTYSPVYQYAMGTSAPTAQRMSGAIVIESDSVTGPDVIDLTGLAQPLAVQSPNNNGLLVSFLLSQNSLVFPIVSVGNSTTAQAVSISNTGATVIHIASLLAAADFTVNNGDCITALLPGQRCTLTVAFSPQTASTPGSQRVGALEIGSDSSASLEFVSLLGTAQPAALAIAPATLSFGQVALGATATLPVHLTNTSSAAVTLNGISSTGDYTATGDCPTDGNKLASNASCTLQVTFTPVQTGARTGTIGIANSSTAQPLAVPLSGTGIQAQLQLSSSSLDFGRVFVSQSAALTLTVTNSGTAPVTGLRMTATGDYTIASGCSAATVAPGSSCTVSLSFAPTAAGTRSGVLSIYSSDPNSPAQVQLTGTGLQNGSFTITVDKSSSPAAVLTTGQQAQYMLDVTALNGYQGVVAIGCAPQSTVPNTYCSVQTASVALNGSAASTSATTMVTITTVTGPGPGVATGRTSVLRNDVLLCMLLPAGLMFAVRRSRYLRTMLWMLVVAISIVGMQGCGSGANQTLRYAMPGTYSFVVTGTSTNGIPLTQSVTLSLTVKSQ